LRDHSCKLFRWKFDFILRCVWIRSRGLPWALPGVLHVDPDDVTDGSAHRRADRGANGCTHCTNGITHRCANVDTNRIADVLAYWNAHRSALCGAFACTHRDANRGPDGRTHSCADVDTNRIADVLAHWGAHRITLCGTDACTHRDANRWPDARTHRDADGRTHICANIDTDGKADVVADRDTHVCTHSDANCVTNGRTHRDADGRTHCCTNIDANSNANIVTQRRANVCTHRDANCSANGRTDRNTDGCTHRWPHVCTQCWANINTNCDANRVTNGSSNSANGFANCVANKTTNRFSLGFTDQNTHGRAYSDANGHAHVSTDALTKRFQRVGCPECDVQRQHKQFWSFQFRKQRDSRVERRPRRSVCADQFNLHRVVSPCTRLCQRNHSGRWASHNVYTDFPTQLGEHPGGCGHDRPHAEPDWHCQRRQHHAAAD
jgi:hypothetical protein